MGNSAPLVTMDYDFELWVRQKLVLHRLCIDEHGLTLIAALCELPEICPQSEVDRIVYDWIDQHVGRDLQQRILEARRDRGNAKQVETIWQPLLALFANVNELAKRLAHSRAALCKSFRERSGGRGVLWKVLERYFSDTRNASEGSGHRLRNWTVIDRTLRVIRREWEIRAAQVGGMERQRLLHSIDDCAALAEEVLARAEDPEYADVKLRDVVTVEGVLMYIYGFGHPCIPDRPEVDVVAAPEHLSGVADAIARCIEKLRQNGRLKDVQAQAIEIEYLVDMYPKMARDEHKKHLGRVRAALRILRPCIERYIDGSNA